MHRVTCHSPVRLRALRPDVSWRTFGAKPNGCPVGIDRPSLASLPWGRLDAATAESVYVCMYGRVARGDWEKYNLGAMSVSPVYDLRTNTLFVPLGMLDVSMNHAARPHPAPPHPIPPVPSPWVPRLRAPLMRA